MVDIVVIIFALLSVIVMALLVGLNLLGIPGSLIMLVVPLVWAFTPYLSFAAFGLMAALVAVGELIEFGLGYIAGKRKGMDNVSMVLSALASVVFGALMAPIMFGLGAVIGALLGAFAGTFLYELVMSRDTVRAVGLAWSSLLNRMLGTAVKTGIGASVIVLLMTRIF